MRVDLILGYTKIRTNSASLADLDAIHRERPWWDNRGFYRAFHGFLPNYLRSLCAVELPPRREGFIEMGSTAEALALTATLQSIPEIDPLPISLEPRSEVPRYQIVERWYYGRLLVWWGDVSVGLCVHALWCTAAMIFQWPFCEPLSSTEPDENEQEQEDGTRGVQC